MNIFILDTDIDLCAEYHVDKHIVKMPLEHAQMLCTTHWVDKFLGYVPRKLNKEELQTLRTLKKSNPRPFPYLPAMENHPCTIWARQCTANYEWLWCLTHALNEEYRYRYGKEHKSFAEVVLKLPLPCNLPSLSRTVFAQAMPEELKSDDAVASYRLFYHKDKATFASWKYRSTPWWWNDAEASYDIRITA